MMRFSACDSRWVLLGAAVVLCGHLWDANPARAQEGGPAGEAQLSTSLPEIVVESPSIEHLIASRVRPLPPKRLGVRLPAVFVEPEIPAVRLPPRPIPPEKEPGQNRAGLLGGLLDEFIFIDESEQFAAALAYLRQDSPLEALSLLDRLTKTTSRHFWRAASLFWAGETLLRLGRAGEATARRKRLLRLLLTAGARYVAAARYALAQERCEARDYRGCLDLLDGQSWSRKDFAYEEAIFLRGWAQAQADSVDAALDAWTGLANVRGRLAVRALVVLGHTHLKRGDYARAAKRYAAAEALGSKGGGAGSAPLEEALYGIAWTRLFLGRTGEAKRAFSLFARRHPKHPLRASVEAGLLSVEIEALPKSRGGLGKLRTRLLEFSRTHRQKTRAGALRLQLAWKLFRMGAYREASVLAGRVSDEFPLGRIYRVARVVEGLSLYHLDKVKRAYGILRLGADHPPVSTHRLAERDAARSAAMATAFAAFRLKDFGGARDVLRHWAFLREGEAAISRDALAALWYGEAAFELGALDEAERAFRAVPADAPEFYRALGGRAWVQYRKKNWKEAALAFDRVFEAGPRGALAAEALARSGEARFNLRDYEGALRSFESVEKKYRGSGVAREALYQKAKLLFRRNRFDAAERSFRAFLEHYPRSEAAPEVEYLLALVPFRRGDYSRARRKLLDFLEKRPDSPLAGEGYLRAADSSYNEGRYREANRLYRLMMNRYPSHPKLSEAVYGRLLSHLQLGEHADFLSSAREYIDKYPESSLGVSLAFQIGEVLFAQKKLGGALKAYGDVVAHYPDHDLAAHAILRIAGIHRNRKDIDKALDSYETLLTRYPEGRLRADALFGSGETLAGIGRCAEAKRRLAAFLEAAPGHDYEMLARFVLGRCLVRLAEYGAALPHLAAVMKAQSTAGANLRSEAALLAAGAYRRRRKYRAAERALAVAVEWGAPALAGGGPLRARADILRARGSGRGGGIPEVGLSVSEAEDVGGARTGARGGDLRKGGQARHRPPGVPEDGQGGG